MSCLNSWTSSQSTNFDTQHIMASSECAVITGHGPKFTINYMYDHWLARNLSCLEPRSIIQIGSGFQELKFKHMINKDTQSMNNLM